MTEYTRPATWDDLKRIAQYLNEAGVDYALVGGYALAVHGFTRFTEDIDILVDPGAENSRRWIIALGRLPEGATLELAAQADVFATDKRYAVRVNDVITIDLLPSVAEHTWEDMKAFVEQRDLDGVPIRVLSLEGLLKTKQGVRPKDQADAQVLRAAIEQLKRLRHPDT
jgi:hypothetical protein